MKIRWTLYLGLVFLASLAAEETKKFQLQPQLVFQVPETTALGYGNGRKLLSDPDGTMYFSAVGKAPNGNPGVCVIRRAKSTGTAGDFEKVWIENSNGVVTSGNMHFASSLAGPHASMVYVVWTGGDRTGNNDPKLAHQVRFARLITSGAMTVSEAGQPFTVTGFDKTYKPPYVEQQHWQEFPSAMTTKDGKLHVVWEARDRKRTSPNGAPLPGIAYAVRDSAGKWSVNGEIEAPPYLDVKSVDGPQFRPFMATDGGDLLHVVCYGVENRRMQILYGHLKSGVFSGWSQIARSDGDQRHVSVSIDNQGRVHAAWREGDRANQKSFIAYSMRKPDGSWTPAQRMGDSTRSASTPNITVDDQAAYVVWTGWTEGFENSDAQKNNGFPNDNDTVEGSLEFAYKKFDDHDFSTPVFLTGGIGSYPRIARMGKTAKLAVIWTLGSECLPTSCVQINFSELIP